MDRVIRALIILVPLTVTVPALAQNVTAFDGTYAGVSNTVDQFDPTAGRCPPPTSPRPGTLTVANGIAKTPAAEGTVSAQGVLVLHDPNGAVRRGQIDAQGNATAKFIGTACVYTFVWRKAAR
jgi:hypothetical protein